MKTLSVILASFLLFSCNQTSNQPVEYTIAFGSCAHQDADNHLWKEIIENEPDLWIWLGDNIYGDSEDPEILRAKYEKQKSKPGYQELLKKAPVIGVWDDHDFGMNDAGKELSIKESSKALLLDFLEVSEDSDVRNREGAYQSYTYAIENHKIKVILLDTRFFRDMPIKDALNGTYTPSYTGDILGAEQWQWLEKEFMNDDADVNILASSIQVIPEEHNYEKWQNFPNARKRLFNLIDRYKPKGLFLISGDRHVAEFSKMKVGETPLYEFTSSGITSTWNKVREEQNVHRVGKMMIARNFGIINLTFHNNKTEVVLQARGEGNKLLGEMNVEFPETGAKK